MRDLPEHVRRNRMLWDDWARKFVAAGEKAWQRGDYITALREFLPLAKSGNPEAEFRVGFIYCQGTSPLSVTNPLETVTEILSAGTTASTR